MAKTDECFVFTAEIDHIDKENNVYDHNEGTFEKYVPPLSTDSGHAALSVSHSQELYNAINESFSSKFKCRLLLVKGTKFGVSSGSIRAAVDRDQWIVESLAGSIDEGYRFRLVRTI